MCPSCLFIKGIFELGLRSRWIVYSHNGAADTGEHPTVFPRQTTGSTLHDWQAKEPSMSHRELQAEKA